MKKLMTILMVAALFVLVTAPAMAAKVDPLDGAIREASNYLNTKIPAGSKVAFTNIAGGYPDLADYVLGDLERNGVNDGKFTVVDRARLDEVRAELNFNASGEVSDSSAQAIGQVLGAQTIVIGGVRKIGENFRLDVKAIEVQTAKVQGSWSSKNIANKDTIAELTKRTAPVQVATPAPAKPAAPAPAAQTPPPAAPAPIVVDKPPTPAPQSAGPKNGTYTFYPRPRAMKNGLDINVYLDKIVIRSGYMNLFFVDRPNGKGSGGVSGNLHHDKLIQDLDRPSRSFNGTGGYREDRDTGAVSVTFEKVTATRFSFTATAYGEVQFYFEEITLGEPD